MRNEEAYVKALSDQIEQLNVKAQHLSRPLHLDGTKGGAPIDMSDTVAEIIQAKDELAERMQTLLEKQREAERMIGQMTDGRVAAVLTYRYLCGYTWEKVAEAEGCSVVHAHRLHQKGIQALNKILRY